MTADLGKTGSVFLLDGRSWSIRVPFHGKVCTKLHTTFDYRTIKEPGRTQIDPLGFLPVILRSSQDRQAERQNCQLSYMNFPETAASS